MLCFAGVCNPFTLPFNTVGGIFSALLPFIFTLAGMVALVFLIWGGIRYMTARGDPKATDAARSTITSAVVGLLVILFAAAIMFIVGSTFNILPFSFLSPVQPAYAQGFDIGTAVRLDFFGSGSQGIRAAFANPGVFFTAIVRIAVVLSATIFIAMMVWGGIRYVNAGGDPKSAGEARQTLTNALIGLLIVVVSFVIIEIVTRVAGTGSIF